MTDKGSGGVSPESGYDRLISILFPVVVLMLFFVFFDVLYTVFLSVYGESVLPEEQYPVFNIGLNGLTELDYTTKKQIYEIRTRRINEYPFLAPRGYTPRSDVFGGIVDGKPWWGILGLSFYGPGRKGIEGDSLQSLYIENPYLLVGLDEGFAYIVDEKRAESRGLEPTPIYPMPVSLVWAKQGDWAKAVFNITELRAQQNKFVSSANLLQNLQFVAYNARDLGFNYLYLVPEKSPNINVLSKGTVTGFFSQTSKKPLLIKHFIHRGDSCGYPGGCNNISPHQSEFVIRYYSLPARAYLKMWREKPDSVEEEPDMVYVMELV